MRKYTIPIFLLLLVSLAVPVQAAELTLRLSNQYSAAHPISRRIIRPWAERVATVTQGRIQIEVFDDSSLGPPQLMIDDCLNGVMDIAVVAAVYYPNQLILSGVFDLPFVASGNSEKDSIVVWETLQAEASMRQEFTGFEVLWVFMNPPYQIHSSKRPVRTLSDLRDGNVATTGVIPYRSALMLDLPVESMSLPMIANALELGLADSCFLPYAPLRPFGMAEHVRFHTDVNLLSNSFYVVMNREAWDRVSPADQKAILNESGRSMSRKSGKVFDDHTRDDMQSMRQRGDEFHFLSEHEMAGLLSRLAPLHDDWIRRANHPDARPLLDKVKKAMRDARTDR